VEIAALVLGILLEKMRPDLWLRRRLARLPRVWGVAAVPLPVALAGLDTRRLALRPSTLLVLYVLSRIFFPALPATDAYEGVNRTVGFSLGLLGVFVLVVLASIAGRDRDLELVEATPARLRTRLLSWVLLLSVLALLEYGVLALLRFGRAEPVYGAFLPNAWELTQGPIMLLGAGLLGVLLARLLPGWLAAPVGAVVVVGWVGVLSGAFERTSMLAPVIEWVQYHDDPDALMTIEPGSFGWHNAYLLGMCGLGVVALMLTVPGRRRGLVAAGVVLTVGTVVAGALAIP
jgi:hypothetical protein